MLLAGAAVASGCSEPSPVHSPGECSPAGARELCEREGDASACGWADLYERRVDGVSLAAETGAGTVAVDAAMIALVPELAGKTFVDEEPAVPPAQTLVLLGYAPHEVDFPVDWTADPASNNSWRMYFQNLGWLHRPCRDGGAGLDAGMYILHDWVGNAMYSEPALEWTWDDHALAVRLNNAAHCLARYAESHEVLNQRLVHAAVSIIVTHLHALGVDACYKPRNNHGVMEDLAVLKNVRRYPSLREGEALWELAQARLEAQIEASVTRDGIHVENSPDYHLVFLGLVNEAIDVLHSWGEVPTPPIADARDRLLGALVYQLQPDLSLPQFGDTENGVRQQQIARLLADARRQGGRGPAYDQLEWVLTGGTAGTEPASLDRVFEVGGYAAFRSGWSAGDRSAITAHFACKRLTTVHYHPDDTSFEIFGHGRELIVDTGKYSYDDSEPMVAHQYATAAHNVLTIDHADFRENGMPAIVAHGTRSGLSWVQGAHSNYEHLGIRSQSRTFAHHKPDTFVVVDHVSADGAHEYVQHFHLHPTLSSITRTADGVIVATTPDRPGPTVVLAPEQPPARFGTPRGTQDDELTQGWYFPGWEIAHPSTDVIFRYHRDAGDHDFPVVITVVPPGRRPILPAAVAYSEADGIMQISWQLDRDPRQVAIPRPPVETSPLHSR